jgi:hypothetical protein
VSFRASRNFLLLSVLPSLLAMAVIAQDASARPPWMKPPPA